MSKQKKKQPGYRTTAALPYWYSSWPSAVTDVATNLLPPPTLEEEEVAFDRLYNLTWEQDSSMGVTALEKMQNTPVLKFDIEGKEVNHESAVVAMYLQGYPPTYI